MRLYYQVLFKVNSSNPPPIIYVIFLKKVKSKRRGEAIFKQKRKKDRFFLYIYIVITPCTSTIFVVYVVLGQVRSVDLASFKFQGRYQRPWNFVESNVCGTTREPCPKKRPSAHFQTIKVCLGFDLNLNLRVCLCMP